MPCLNGSVIPIIYFLGKNFTRLSVGDHSEIENSFYEEKLPNRVLAPIVMDF